MARRDVSMSSDEITQFLAAPATGVLTTLGANGWPHSVGMWFVVDRDELRMWTYAKSQKVVNARRDPRSAFLVEDGVAYDTLRGILVRGKLRLVTEVEEIFDIGKRLYERYTQPHTGVPAESGPEVELRRQANKRVGLVLPLDRVASWDHRKITTST